MKDSEIIINRLYKIKFSSVEKEISPWDPGWMGDLFYSKELKEKLSKWGDIDGEIVKVIRKSPDDVWEIELQDRPDIVKLFADNNITLYALAKNLEFLNSSCNCDIKVLMTQGCQCGGE